MRLKIETDQIDVEVDGDLSTEKITEIFDQAEKVTKELRPKVAPIGKGGERDK